MPEIDQWVEKLADLQPWIIVEGPKDKAALRKLGLENVIYLRGKPLFEVVEWIASMTDECMILTDLDREGKKLYSVLRAELQKHGVKIDDKFRNFLFKETDLRQIEGLYNYVQRQNSQPI
ncbi:MAG: toprim domain-containing protein [Candidatus Woesearchaeota archaeon]